MRLHATCSHLWLNLKVFTTIRSNFNYFGHSYNYDATIENFIVSFGWILSVFSFINKLICLISYNSHQITPILKIFYDDIGVYFYVCIKIMFMIYYTYINIYIFYINYAYVHILFIYWILKLIFELWNLLFKYESWYFSFENYIWIKKFDIPIVKNIMWICNFFFSFWILKF